MRRDFKTVNLKHGMLHVETPLGIVNIMVGLSDSEGRRVNAIQVIPDESIGSKKVRRRGFYNTRLVELKGVNR